MKQVYDENGTLLNLLQDNDIVENNGNVKLPNGTLIQYGIRNVASGYGQEIYFPLAFKDEYATVIFSSNDSNCILTNVYAHNCYVQTSKEAKIWWLAIGRWK